MKKSIINFLYKCIETIEKIEYRKLNLDENDVSKKIIEEYNIEDYQVTSDSGLVDISQICITQPFTHYELILENGLKLTCADNHIVFDGKLNEIFVRNLNIGDILNTNNGNSKVVSVIRLNRKTSMGDLTIDHPNHRYYTNGILSHNTICAAIFILHFMLFNNTKNVLIAANQFDTSKEVLDKIKTIYSYLPFFLQQGIDVWNINQIKFQNGCRAKAFAMTGNSAIGQAADLVYVDEFAHINNTVADKFYKSIFPTLSSIENSKMIITSTPDGYNLFHKLLSDAEREESDPLKNSFAPLRVYWYQVPGRNVTYLKINPYLMAQHNLTEEMVVDQCKAIYNPNDEVTPNKIPIVELKTDPNSGKKWIHIQNNEILTFEHICKTEFLNKDEEYVHCSQFCSLSTWKRDATKDIGGEDNFNQEYDLRFAAGSRSVVSEATIERLKANKKLFEHRHELDMFKTLKWDWSALKFREDWDDAARKNIYSLISIDISEGLGQDYSVVNMFQLEYKPLKLIEEQKDLIGQTQDFFRLTQYGMFRSNIISHDQLAEMVYLLTFDFLDPDKTKLVIEYNNDGKAFLQAFSPGKIFEGENDYSGHVVLKFKHRIDAQERSKGLKVGPQKNRYVKDYQQRMERQEFVVYHDVNITEIATFISHTTPAGNTIYRGDGSNDDCVPSETLITTNNGIKIIKDIKVGDYVLTHIGRYKKVLKTSKRYSKYVYNISSNNKMDIKVTDNHQLFLHEKKSFTNRDRKLKFHDGKWISINDNINIKKHYTSFIPNKEIREIREIDLYEYCDKNKFILKDNKIYSIMYENKNVINPNQNPIDRYLKIDNDFCFVMGYYLAEGSRNEHQISFSSHIDEKNIRSYIRSYFEGLGLTVFEKNRIGKSNYLTISSKILSNFFKIFSSKENKKLPIFCNYLSNNKKRQIINGYLIGDGCFSQRGIRSVSISPSISFFIYESLVNLGYKPSFKLQKQPKNKTWNSKDFVYCVNINNYDKMDIINNYNNDILLDKKIKIPSVVSDKKSYQKFNGDYLIGKIKNIQEIYHNDYVYNLEVEDDHSYIANGIVVHNCAMTLVNMSQGWKNPGFKELVESYHADVNNTNIEKLMSEILKDGRKTTGTDYDSFFKGKASASNFKTRTGEIDVSNLF